jgi:hypothetical protein
MGNRKITAAVADDAEPIKLDDAAAHLRLTKVGGVWPEEALLKRNIKTARQMAEKYTGKTYAPRTVVEAFDAFPTRTLGVFSSSASAFVVVDVPQSESASLPLELGLEPVETVASIKYDDTDGVEQTLDPATYELDAYGRRNRVLLKAGQQWPFARKTANAVRVAYTTKAECDEIVISAMLLTIDHLDRNRSATTDKPLKELPLGVCALLDTDSVDFGI